VEVVVGRLGGSGGAEKRAGECGGDTFHC
jgi:hypothetical protein